MLKKLCLVATTALCATISAEAINGREIPSIYTDGNSIPLIPYSTIRKIEIHNALDHIAQEIKAIYSELSLALSFLERGEQHFQEQLGDDYEPRKQRAMDVLKTILESPEFATTVQQVTDEQVMLIVDQLVNFNDIIIDPSAFPLEQKIENELKAAAFDEQMQQIFNIFYVALVTKRGVEMLLEKLAIRSHELMAERGTL